jgi:hypothetical protein
MLATYINKVVNRAERMNAMSIASTHPPDMSMFFGFIDMTIKTPNS